jgi:hypothetical protein
LRIENLKLQIDDRSLPNLHFPIFNWVAIGFDLWSFNRNPIGMRVSSAPTGSSRPGPPSSQAYFCVSSQFCRKRVTLDIGRRSRLTKIEPVAGA